jgi:2-phospho-L-lactate guanylyltransferase
VASSSVARCVAIIPVKPPLQGKSRLRDVPSGVRERLAAAFADDAVRACLAADRVAAVLVVTDDPGVAARAVELGARATADGPEGGLNGALRHAARTAAPLWPDLRPLALCADLPAVRPAELDVAVGLLTAAAGAAYVVDADGTGTTAYSAPYDAFDPQYGAGSAAAHLAAGARPLPGELAGLRRDVDDLADLRGAVALGVGAATRRVLPEVPGLLDATA